MNAALQRRLSGWLLACLSGLALLLVILFCGVGSGVHWDLPHPPAPLPRLDAMRPPPAVPQERYAQVWERPLFSHDRRPAAEAETGGSVSLGDLELTGIILTPSLKMALLRDKSKHGAATADDNGVPAPAASAGAGTSEVRVRLGESVPGGQWTLNSLHPRSAVFVSGSSRTELKLPVAAPLSVVPAPAPAASAEQPPAGRQRAWRELLRRRAQSHHDHHAAAAAAASSRDH